ncbi:OmpA family protein [Arcticibacter sp.]|uniref:OmpA family protein n=1 Tax=Arcticibacter sp. TaxID=1872630 RepID=UPI00388E5DF8
MTWLRSTQISAYVVVVTTMAMTSPSSQAQSILKKIKDRAAQTATGKILDKTEKAISKGIDKTVEKTSAEQDKPTSGESKTRTFDGSLQPASTVKAFSKFDFIAGDSILYVNDFSDEAFSELPAGWNSNGSAVLVKLDGLEGQWLRMAQRTVCLSDNKKMLGDDFTVEFDMFLQIDFKGWLPPSIRFGLLATGKADPAGNSLLSDPKGDKSLYMEISPLSTGANIAMESYINHKRYFNSPTQSSSLAKKWYGKVVHVSLQGQKERLRIWVDEDKIYDVPKAIPLEGMFNQLFFQLSSSPYQDDQIGVYFTNIKIAKGMPDLRHKWIEEGKFSTTGILFDTGSATIRAESAGVLKSIADVLNQNKDTKIRIVGHTDAVGEEKTNQQLSERRALAVKAVLHNTFGISEERLEAMGKGESSPASTEKTKEAMARNRRVEFVRL